MKLNWLSAIIGGLIGLGFAVAIHLLFGARIDLAKLFVFGGIGVVISIAMELGRQNGIRKAEFGKDSKERHHG